MLVVLVVRAGAPAAITAASYPAVASAASQLLAQRFDVAFVLGCHLSLA
ncbi:MAG: hypothetical protein R3E84_15375 [Pseudomonadales bacterium]